MTTLELDNETTALLTEIAENEHISLAQLANRLLVECLEDYQDARLADKAYQRHIDNGAITHKLNDVVKELGLGS